MGTPCPTATAGRGHGAGRRGNCGLQRPDSRPEVGTKHVENVAELVCTASAPTLLFNAIEPQVCKHTHPVPACRGDLSHERVESTPKDLQRRRRRRWRVSLQGPSNHASDLVSGAPVALTGLHVQQRLITSRGLLYQIIPSGTKSIRNTDWTVCSVWWNVWVPAVAYETSARCRQLSVDT